MQFRIGDRDPETGLYGVIWPDGTSTLNGIKNFSAGHQVGDLVMGTRRSDGMLILDGLLASDPTNSDLAIKNFNERPVGYLNGQVFNNEDEEPQYDLITVKFAPNLALSFDVGQPNEMNLYVSNTRRTTSILWDTTLGQRPLEPDLVVFNQTGLFWNEYNNFPHYTRSLQATSTPNRYIDYAHVNYEAARTVFARHGYRYLIFAYLRRVPGNDSAPFGTMAVSLSKTIPARPRLSNSNQNGYGLYYNFVDYGAEDVDRPYAQTARKRKNYVNIRWLLKTTAINGQPISQTRFQLLYAACFIQVDTQNPKDIRFLEPIINPDVYLVQGQRPQIIS